MVRRQRDFLVGLTVLAASLVLAGPVLAYWTFFEWSAGNECLQGGVCDDDGLQYGSGLPTAQLDAALSEVCSDPSVYANASNGAVEFSVDGGSAWQAGSLVDGWLYAGFVGDYSTVRFRVRGTGEAGTIDAIQLRCGGDMPTYTRLLWIPFTLIICDSLLTFFYSSSDALKRAIRGT